MYYPIFEDLSIEHFFSPMRTIYVFSDSQLEEIKLSHRKEELKDLKTSRKRIVENYQAQLKALNKREEELDKEMKALSPTKKEKVVV